MHSSSLVRRLSGGEYVLLINLNMPKCSEKVMVAISMYGDWCKGAGITPLAVASVASFPTSPVRPGIQISSFPGGCLRRIWCVGVKTLPCIKYLHASCESVKIIALGLEAVARVFPLGGYFQCSRVYSSSIWCCDCRYHLSLVKSGSD